MTRLRDHIPEILAFIAEQKPRLLVEKDLFSVYEGGLLEKVDAILKTQLGERSAQEAIERMPPINILNKLVQKLSTLYIDAPDRTPDSTKDKDLISYYTDSMDFDSFMYDANIFFNLHRRVALEPYVKDNKPRLRVLPGHRFLVWSNDRQDPTIPTVFIKFMGSTVKKVMKDQREQDELMDIFWLYTDDEFMAITSDGEVHMEDMVSNPSGENPYGKIPFVYVNSSRYSLLPEPDKELLRMTLLVPILYSDINFAAKYQTFSIIYGIDVDTENLKQSPNAIWLFKTEDERPKAEIGSIKPDVDMEAMTQSIANQLATFFETRNLRGATISGFAAGRYGQQDSGGQHGIALLIQNLDTTEIRKAHSKVFEAAEKEFWSLISEHIHPVWVTDGRIDNRSKFSKKPVRAQFSPEYEIKSDMDLLNEIQQKLNSGLITRKMALEQLYPHMTETEINQLLEELREDESLNISSEMFNANTETDIQEDGERNTQEDPPSEE